MDAVKFIKERNRMCLSYNKGCSKCPADELDCSTTEKDIERLVAVVEKWSKENPLITNRQKLKEVFGIEIFKESMLEFNSGWLDREYKAPKEGE